MHYAAPHTLSIFHDIKLSWSRSHHCNPRLIGQHSVNLLTCIRGHKTAQQNALFSPLGGAERRETCMCVHVQVPVSFVYGEADWMDPQAGVRVAASVRQSRGSLSHTDCQVRR